MNTRDRFLRIFVFVWLGVLFAFPLRSPADSTPTVFLSGLQIPVGIAVDRDSNIFVHSDATFTTLLSKFSPNGANLGAIRLGGIAIDEFVGSRLEPDPITGNILLLTPRGLIYSVDRGTGQYNVLADLSRLAFSTWNRVYDVLRSEYRPLALGNPAYGDFAALRRSNSVMDLFISANTGASGGFPFIMRVTVDYQQSSWVADVIVTSQGTTAGNVNLPSGIAVNSAGTVLTALTFPVRIATSGFANGLVSFSAGFSNRASCPGSAVCPRFAVTSPDGQPLDFANTGMTADTAGNFYIASGIIGSTACGLGAGDALVVFPANLNPRQAKCLGIDFPIGHSSDVAVAPVSPNENRVYLTIGALQGGVLQMLVNPPASGPASSLDLAATAASPPKQKCRRSRRATRCRLSARFLVRNQGSTGTPKVAFRVVVSSDPVLSADDLVTTQLRVKKLKPGKAAKLGWRVRLPQGIDASGKYLIGVVDFTNALAENDENNNFAVLGPLP